VLLHKLETTKNHKGSITKQHMDKKLRVPVDTGVDIVLRNMKFTQVQDIQV